jgi:hypothetical protein
MGHEVYENSDTDVTVSGPLEEHRELLAQVHLWSSIWSAFVNACARHRVQSKPDRQFPGDWQEYRRKSRGLENRRLDRKPGCKPTAQLRVQPQSRQNSKGNTYLLS